MPGGTCYSLVYAKAVDVVTLKRPDRWRVGDLRPVANLNLIRDGCPCDHVELKGVEEDRVSVPRPWPRFIIMARRMCMPLMNGKLIGRRSARFRRAGAAAGWA